MTARIAADRATMTSETPMRTLLPLLLVSCIDLDRGPEWNDDSFWRDTSRDDWSDTDAVDTDAWSADDTEGPPGADCLLTTADFFPIQDGDELIVYWGPQGLWHVFASVTCLEASFEPGGDVFDFDNEANPTVSMELIDDDRGRIGGYVDLRRGMDYSGSAALIDEQLVIRTTTCEENLGREVTLRLAVEDVNGLQSSAQVRVTLIGDPNHEYPDPIDTDPPEDTDGVDTDPPEDTDAFDTDDTDLIPDPGETGGADTDALDTGDTDPA
jgi:hypothetical protein